MQCFTIIMVVIIMVNFSLGNRIKELRNRYGYSQEQLALRAEITTAYLGMVERGEKNPTVKVIERICLGLGISLSEFFSDSFVPHSELDDLSLQILQQLDGKTTDEKRLILDIVRQALKLQDV